MVVIVENVTSKNEEGSDEVIVEAANGIERDIKDLRRYFQGATVLSSRFDLINEELDKITVQSLWLLGISTRMGLVIV
jgi:hypothetical protein